MLTLYKNLKLITIVVVLVLSFAMRGVAQTSIYNYSIATKSNPKYPLSNFQGKKMMIVVLPAGQGDTDLALIKRIDSIALAHPGSLRVIAVPSSTDGATDNNDGLNKWYTSLLDSSIILSKSQSIYKVNNGKQPELFQWLTHANLNVHFDDDTAGPGSMYFINEKGELYSVFEPGARFSNKALSKVL
jgi:glutathione peroxidase-family protein